MDDLRTRLTEDLKSAMRAKDAVRTDTIRGVRAAVLNREVETGVDLDEAAIQQVIIGLVKQRAESITQYAEGGRQDLVDREQQEKEILQAYLPAAPDAAEVETTVKAVIAELGAAGMKDMGRVMQACKAKLGPVVDGKTLSGIVKAALTACLVIILACATPKNTEAQAGYRSKLRQAIGTEVSTRQQRDDQSRLLVEVVESGALEGLNRDQVRQALGPGIVCVTPRVCSEQGFGADDWYYEIGVMADPGLKQMPLLLLGFDLKGVVTRTWTLTTH